MVETAICLCGLLILGGITKVCCTDKRYTEEYHRYLRNNGKQTPEDIKSEYFRYL